MAWGRTGDKPLTEQMPTQLNDAYMRHPASMSYIQKTQQPVRVIDETRLQLYGI